MVKNTKIKAKNFTNVLKNEAITQCRIVLTGMAKLKGLVRLADLLTETSYMIYHS